MNDLEFDLPREELHWLAGLLEGEGSFFTGPPTSPHLPVVQIAMVDEDVMERVGRIFRRKVWRSEPRRSHWRATYQVRLTGSRAVALMQMMRPLMGQRRRAQIDRALASYAPRSNTLLDDELAAQALALLATGASVREVAEHFGTTVWCIYDLRSGRTHKRVPRPLGLRAPRAA